MQQFLPHLIFNGFKFDAKDPRYVIPVHAMKVDLRNNLQALIPSLRENLQSSFRAVIPIHDKHDEGSTLISCTTEVV